MERVCLLCYKSSKLKYHLHKCVGCKHWFCEGHITYAPDPFAEEIYGVTTSIWECADCRQNSADDI